MRRRPGFRYNLLPRHSGSPVNERISLANFQMELLDATEQVRSQDRRVRHMTVNSILIKEMKTLVLCFAHLILGLHGATASLK